MPVSRRRYDDLQTRYQNLAENHEQLKAELQASRGATLRLAGNYTRLMETGEPMPMFSRPSKVQQRIAGLERRIRLARKAGARLLAAYHAEKHRADHLQTRLDYALGLNSAAVEDGKNWQARRTDKPTAKETSS
jgi:uncharacterized protein (DUF3084 family)